MSEEMDELELAKVKAKKIVEDLLAATKVNAKVSARILEPEDDHDRQLVLIEITGKDLSIFDRQARGNIELASICHQPDPEPADRALDAFNDRCSRLSLPPGAPAAPIGT